jgi:FMN phosphatase YigB (HAD superfamily)
LLTENIKNIIFDLGGVILDLDLEAAYKEFSRLSELPVEEVIRSTKGLMLF